MKWLWHWVNSGPKWEVTLHVGVLYVFGVPMLPLLNITIERIDRR